MVLSRTECAALRRRAQQVLQPLVTAAFIFGILIPSSNAAMETTALKSSLSSTSNSRVIETQPAKKVLLFWASWCGYCKTSLKQFDKAEANQRLGGYSAVAVNIYDEKADPKAFLNQLDVSLTSKTAASFAKAAKQVKVLPWVVLLDENGEIIASQRPQKSVEGNERWIESITDMHGLLSSATNTPSKPSLVKPDSNVALQQSVALNSQGS